MSFVVRNALSEDVEAIVVLVNKLHVDQTSTNPYFKDKIEFIDVNEQYLEHIKNPNRAIFVVESDHSIVGFIEVRIHEKDFYFHIDNYAYILHCYVEIGERNHFIMKKLLDAVEEWAISKKVKYLQADVYNHNIRVAQALKHLRYDTYRMRMVKELKNNCGECK